MNIERELFEWRLVANACVKQEGIDKALEIGASGIFERSIESVRRTLEQAPAEKKIKAQHYLDEVVSVREECIAAIQAVLTFRKHHTQS